MGHDNQHLKTHARRLDEYGNYTDKQEILYIVIRLILERGEPASLLTWCPQRSPEACGVLPWEHSFRDMTKRVKDELEGKLMGECEASGYVSLALEGWSDPRGRRYQGVTVRVPTAADHMLQTETHLLALHEIKTIHESAEELRAIIARVRRRYGLAICLNICTDRGSLNITAFRNDIHALQALLDGQTIWLPSTCHILNNVLNAFFKSIGELLAPIFRIQHRFRKSGPFQTYHIRHHSRTTAIPCTSMVRWYSSHALLSVLLELRPLMLAFQEQKGFAVPELNVGVPGLD
jgi:hypothetical protein